MSERNVGEPGDKGTLSRSMTRFDCIYSLESRSCLCIMLLPTLLSRPSRRRSTMLRVTPRQFDLPGQFPDPAKDGDVQSTPRATTTPLSAAATQRTTAHPSAETTQKDTATTRTTHGVHGTTTTRITVSRPKNAGSISASSSTSLPASMSPSHASATITTEVITVSREPIGERAHTACVRSG